MSIADRLRHARLRAGLTGPQVEERTNIGKSSISEFETGRREPRLSQLQAMATVYQRSVAFFLEDGPIPEEAVLWRKRPDEGVEEVEGRFLRLCEQYHNLEVWCNERVPIQLPQAQNRGRPYGYADAEELAKSVRRELQLGDRPAHGLLPALEEVCGVKVFHLDFEPTGTAACTKSATVGVGVLLNSKSVRWRRNHDLAHELFHLLTWQLFREGVGQGCDPGRDEEKFATCFARNLLMPAEATRTAINERLRDGRIAFEALFDIARQFDVSVESLLWHMHFLYRGGPDDSGQTERDIERAKELAPLLEERQNEKPPVRPERYHALAVKALRHGEMALGRFAEYLGISRQQAARYVEQEAPDGEEVQLAPA